MRYAFLIETYTSERIKGGKPRAPAAKPSPNDRIQDRKGNAVIVVISSATRDLQF